MLLFEIALTDSIEQFLSLISGIFTDSLGELSSLHPVRDAIAKISIKYIFFIISFTMISTATIRRDWFEKKPPHKIE